MKLSENWIFEKHLDFEYKQYVLLGYLQEISSKFKQLALYPYLGELIRHYNISKNTKAQISQFENNFPKELKSIGLQGLIYKSRQERSEMIEDIHQILEFAEKQFKSKIEEGKSIYDYFEQEIEIQPIGLPNANNSAGYFIIRTNATGTYQVYEYELSRIELSNESTYALKTTPIKSYVSSWINAYQKIKKELLINSKWLFTPSFYAIESNIDIPLESSFLPIAKRKLYAKIKS